MSVTNNKQSGVVSLIVVIFAALLITTMSVSFIRIMIRGHQEAIDSDLSRSAYDSALAGVEDSKRAILRYQSCLAGIGGNPTSCDYGALQSDICNEAVMKLADVTAVVGTSANKEVKVQAAGEGANKLNQAYTCTKIKLDTPNYLGTLSSDETRVIRLKSKDDVQFDKVKISWFDTNDLSKSSSYTNVYLPGVSSLPVSWTEGTTNPNRPPIFRSQFIQSLKNAPLDSYITSSADLSSNKSSRTLFLYPSQSGVNSINATTDARPSSMPSKPNLTKCADSLIATNYSCSMTVTLAEHGGSGSDSLLRLTSIYGKANFKIELMDSSDHVILFGGVQPIIDSTGRADNAYRRVETRVEFTDTKFPYPEASVDLTGSLCKDFMITDNPDDFPKKALGGNEVGDPGSGYIINGCTM